ADLPGIIVLRPGLITLFAAGGNGVAPPQMLTGLGVPAVDKTANAELSAGNAGHQHTVRNQRRNRERKAILHSAAFDFHSALPCLASFAKAWASSVVRKTLPL